MTYLLQHATRRLRSSREARVDENVRLNLPGFYGDAYVRVYVDDTPGFVLEIADCTKAINLEFSVDSAELRENSLFKIDTLIGALQRFRNGLAAEVELAEHAE